MVVTQRYQNRHRSLRVWLTIASEQAKLFVRRTPPTRRLLEGGIGRDIEITSEDGARRAHNMGGNGAHGFELAVVAVAAVRHSNPCGRCLARLEAVAEVGVEGDASGIGAWRGERAHFAMAPRKQRAAETTTNSRGCFARRTRQQRRCVPQCKKPRPQATHTLEVSKGAIHLGKCEIRGRMRAAKHSLHCVAASTAPDLLVRRRRIDIAAKPARGVPHGE